MSSTCPACFTPIASEEAPPADRESVVCGGCGEHLGWRFSGAAPFYGLLLDRLRGG